MLALSRCGRRRRFRQPTASSTAMASSGAPSHGGAATAIGPTATSTATFASTTSRFGAKGGPNGGGRAGARSQSMLPAPTATRHAAARAARGSFDDTALAPATALSSLALTMPGAGL